MDEGMKKLDGTRAEILKVFVGGDRVATSNVMSTEEDERAFVEKGALIPP